MKNAIIFHGTDANSQSNWFPWLKDELEILGYDVWVPDLPNSSAPSLMAYTRFVADKNFFFNEETLLIGHSSGAVAILGLLPKIGTKVKACYLVAPFEDDLGRPNLRGLFEKPFDFEKIRNNGGKMYFFGSDNDPYVPLTMVDHIALQCAGTLLPMPGQGHFNTEPGPEYRQFYKLLGKIKEDF